MLFYTECPNLGINGSLEQKMVKSVKVRPCFILINFLILKKFPKKVKIKNAKFFGLFQKKRTVMYLFRQYLNTGKLQIYSKKIRVLFAFLP